MPSLRPKTKKLVQQHLRAWNVDDPDERRRLAEATSTRTVRVVSPYGQLSGTAAHLASIAEVRKAFPKLRCRGRLVAEHHGWILVSWTTTFGGVRPPLKGLDVCRLDRRGRISSIISFSPISRR